MSRYSDAPPDFQEAISNGPNGRRPSTSAISTAASSNSALQSTGPADRPIPSPAPSPRRWDDPPEGEPEAPSENRTTLILVHVRRVQTFATHREVIQLEFNSSGSHIAVSTPYSTAHLHADDYRTISFFDTQSWSQVVMPVPPKLNGTYALGHGRPVVAVPFFTAQEQAFNSGSLKPHLEVHDLATRKKVVKGHTYMPIQSPLAYSPDGKILAATSTRDRSKIVLVRAAQEPVQIQRIIANHMGDVTHLAFTPDGTALISASKDGSLRMTNIASGRTLRKFEVPTTRFDCTMMKVSLDGELVASVWGKDVHLWYPQTGDMSGYNLNAVRRTEGWPLCISPDCKYLACRTEEGFDVSNLKDGLFRGEVVAEGTLVTAAAFSSDSKLMVVGKYTGEVHLFEVVT